MNFEDEPYVRLYTRKTLTHKLLGWEGRVVLRLMIDEFDAAGIFEIRGDAAHCISAVTDLPIDIVRTGLTRLLDTETWTVTARAVTWPSYEEAQNCSRSDRVRQRASRKARAARSVTDVTLPVTPEAPVVTSVTKCHSPSPPPSAPSLPSTHPGDPERARALEPVGGVARTYSMPSEEPPQTYLDEAAMRAVSPAQARSTWAHYYGAGLPAQGVEKLYPWLCRRALERATQTARAPASSRGSPPPPEPELIELDPRYLDAAHHAFCEHAALGRADTLAREWRTLVAQDGKPIGAAAANQAFARWLRQRAIDRTSKPPGQPTGGKEAA